MGIYLFSFIIVVGVGGWGMGMYEYRYKYMSIERPVKQRCLYEESIAAVYVTNWLVGVAEPTSNVFKSRPSW